MVMNKRHTTSFDPKGSPSPQAGIRRRHPATSVSYYACQNGILCLLFGHAAVSAGLELANDRVVLSCSSSIQEVHVKRPLVFLL